MSLTPGAQMSSSVPIHESDEILRLRAKPPREYVRKASGVLLSGWKEIAAHLGISWRTAMRWEEQWGLPVIRPDWPGLRVWTLTGAIDRWIRELSKAQARLAMEVRKERPDLAHKSLKRQWREFSADS